VTLGPSGMGRVVIAAGIQAGDTVALSDPERAPDTPGKAPGAASPGSPGSPGSSPARPTLATPLPRTLP